MNRRSFLGLMIGGVATAAARTWPFRVYSFPQEVIPETWGVLQRSAYPPTLAGLKNLLAYRDRIDVLSPADFGHRVIIHPEQMEAYLELGRTVYSADEERLSKALGLPVRIDPIAPRDSPVFFLSNRPESSS